MAPDCNNEKSEQIGRRCGAEVTLEDAEGRHSRQVSIAHVARDDSCSCVRARPLPLVSH